MRIDRRQLLGALGALPMMPLLDGCGRNPRAELAVWAMGNEAASLPALVDFAAPLRKASAPAVTVQALPWSAAHEKLLTGYAGGSLPAVGQIGNSWLAEMTMIGAIAPVPAHAMHLLDDQFGAVAATNHIGSQAYAIPWYVDTRLQFFRTDSFARAGYDAPPLRWAEWKQALHKVKARAGDGNYAAIMPLNEFEQLLTFALSAGARLLRDRNSRGAFRDPEFKAALAFYKSLFDEGLVPVATAAQISNIWNEFARGFFSLFISGPWTIGDLRARLPRAMQGKWATAPNPGPSGMGSTAPGGSSLVVFARHGDDPHAWDFVSLMLEPAAQARLHELTGNLPARRSVWRDAGLASDPIVAPFARQLENASPLPQLPEWERIVTEMQVVADRMVRGRYSVDAAAAEIDRRADRLLEKRRWMLETGRAA